MGSRGIEGRQGLGKGWVSLKMKTYFGISMCQGLGGKKICKPAPYSDESKPDGHFQVSKGELVAGLGGRIYSENKIS